MISRKVSYEDLDGNQVEEVLYFSISSAEIMDLEAAEESLSDSIEKLMNTNDTKEMMRRFKWLISKAYAVRDGNKLAPKDPVVTEQFLESPAFDTLITDLFAEVAGQNTEAVSEFFNGMFPKKLMDQAEKVQTQNVELPSMANTDGDRPRRSLTVPAPQLKIPATRDQAKTASGLEQPFDNKSNLLPWWNRDPNPDELQHMTKPQLLDVTKRKMSGWQAPAAV